MTVHGASDVIAQAKKVLSLRDAAGGIPASIDNSSELQKLAIVIQNYETTQEQQYRRDSSALGWGRSTHLGGKNS